MADVTPAAGLPQLADYTRFARRHRVLLVALVGLGLLVGIVLAAGQKPTYSSTVSIALPPVPKYVTTPDTLLPPEVTIDTDAQLLHNPEVVAAIADALGIEDEEVEPHVTVTASANSHVLHVTVESASRVRAAAAANAAAEAFVQVRRTSLGALQDSQVNQLRILLTAQEELLAKTQSRRIVLLDTDETFAQILALRDALDELEHARDVSGNVIDTATPPRRADYPNHEVPLVSGLMLGFLIGCLAGAAKDRGLMRAPLRALRRFTTRHLSRPTTDVRPTAG